DEVLLALICRLTGSHRPHAPKDFGRLGKIRKGVERGFPGLLKRISTTIWVWQNGVLVRTGAFNLDHDIVYESMCRMAARIAHRVARQFLAPNCGCTCSSQCSAP